jgi:hypothetical protein
MDGGFVEAPPTSQSHRLHYYFPRLDDDDDDDCTVRHWETRERGSRELNSKIVTLW